MRIEIYIVSFGLDVFLFFTLKGEFPVMCARILAPYTKNTLEVFFKLITGLTKFKVLKE